MRLGAGRVGRYSVAAASAAAVKAATRGRVVVMGFSCRSAAGRLWISPSRMFTVLSLRYLDGLGSSPELTIGLLPQRMFHEPGRDHTGCSP